MIEPLAQAKALLEHFKSEVQPTAYLTPIVDRSFRMSLLITGRCKLGIRVTATTHGLCVRVLSPQLPESIEPDALARIGGFLIQISNLVRQIRALAGGNASDRSSAQTAV